MKRFILTFISVVILQFYAYSQTLVQTFMDPCTKVVSTFVIPISGFTTVVFYNKSRVFTASDVQSGVFQAWINQVYEDYRKLSPCSVSSAAVTTTQITANAVSSAVAGAVSSATSSAASSAAASAASSAAAAGAPSPSSSSSSSSSSESSSSSSESSSSESSSSEKSESKSSSSSSKSSSKSEKKSSAKAAARVNPILFNSDLTGGQTTDGSINMIASFGLSKSSMTGAESYGLSAMVFSNLKQFVLSSRYTKMNFNQGKLESISNYGGTVALMYGNLFGFMTYAYIYPMGRYGVTGANLTISIASADYLKGKQFTISHSLLLFYTKPFAVTKRLTLSPDLYLSGSPVTYMTKENLFTVSKDMGFMTGVGVDYSITKRFKFNTGIRTSFSTNPDVPVLLFAVVGSKVNL